MVDLLNWRTKSGKPRKLRPPRKPPGALEFRVCCALADLLKRLCEPGWRWTHFPAGEARTGFAGARLERMGLVPGWPDFQFIRGAGGRAHFLEMKRKGNGLTEAQAEFAAWCVAENVPHKVAYSFDEAVDQLKAWGVLPARIKLQ